ncbi:hypothetical protein JB92DRAFT_3092959 [Gautieria morchelliformis]|nr:hypothetical protein JB92DRAFT_3092959 [Gautieria morchelliformis]
MKLQPQNVKCTWLVGLWPSALVQDVPAGCAESHFFPSACCAERGPGAQTEVGRVHYYGMVWVVYNAVVQGTAVYTPIKPLLPSATLRYREIAELGTVHHASPGKNRTTPPRLLEELAIKPTLRLFANLRHSKKTRDAYRIQVPYHLHFNRVWRAFVVRNKHDAQSLHHRTYTARLAPTSDTYLILATAMLWGPRASVHRSGPMPSVRGFERGTLVMSIAWIGATPVEDWFILGTTCYVMLRGCGDVQTVMVGKAEKEQGEKWSRISQAAPYSDDMILAKVGGCVAAGVVFLAVKSDGRRLAPRLRFGGELDDTERCIGAGVGYTHGVSLTLSLCLLDEPAEYPTFLV